VPKWSLPHAHWHWPLLFAFKLKQAVTALLAGATQREIQLFYGFTEFWGNREEEGGGHAHLRIKLAPDAVTEARAAQQARHGMALGSNTSNRRCNCKVLKNYGVQQYVSISAPVLTQYRCAVCVVCGAKKNTWIMVLSGPVRH
jgi:hypothetical protein